MFYTVYKTTNLINGNIYIGAHQTNNLDDSYMGSGKVITLAIKKYGIENFSKEYLHIFDNPDDMYEMEATLVTPDFIARYDTYNLIEGGFGGFGHLNDGSPEHINRCSKAGIIGTDNGSHIKALAQLEWLKKHNISWRNKWLNKLSEVWRRKYEEDGYINSFQNKKHSVESKRKIGEANSKHQKGPGNSQYGTMWIHSPVEKINKKINKDDFLTWESMGWIAGRKMNFN